MATNLWTSSLPEAFVGEAALSWIDQDTLPRLMLDNALTILWANIAARSALARKRDIEIRGSTLSTVDRTKQLALEAYITGSGVGIASWCLRRADGDGHLIFRAQRICWEGDGVFGLSFHGSGSEFQARYAEFEKIYRLTKAEHRVLREMLDGLGTDRIAALHGVSIETTRSHIRHIYAKVGVKSRESLFHRLRAFRI